MAFVYILECSDGSFYTGWTADLERRLATHDSGRGARYTRGRRPVRLVHWEGQPDRSSAQRREAELRRLSRPLKLRLIADHLQGLAPGSSQGGAVL